MDAIEVIIWVLAVLGVLVANLYKQWQRHREMRHPRRGPLVAQRTPEAQAPPVPAAPQEGRGRFDEDTWGRAPPEADEPVSLEELLEQALGTRAEQAKESAKEAPLPPPVPQVVREAPVYTTAAQRPTPRAAPVAAPRAGMRRRHPPLFNPHTDLRAAVIGMTVLGPCRALAPYEAPDAPGRGS